MTRGAFDDALREALLEVLSSPQVEDILMKLVAKAMRNELGRLLDEELLDTKAAAKLLGSTAGAVRKAAERGQIPVHKVNRRLRFRRSELLARQNGGRLGPGSHDPP